MDLTSATSNETKVNSMCSQLEEIQKMVHDNISTENLKYKEKPDQYRRLKSFEDGEFVMVSWSTSEIEDSQLEVILSLIKGTLLMHTYVPYA